jgi:AhpD family alkylhydroperoxidase
MSDLTLRERELVSLGAAMGSNCLCIQDRVQASRKAGLSDAEISEAIRLAESATLTSPGAAASKRCCG